MSNVVEFKLKNGYDHIMFFLDGLESDNTRVSYEDSIRKFVHWKWDIPIEHVQPHHFNSVTYTDTKKFRSFLRRKYSAGTTNNKMTGIFSLFKELNKIQDEETNEYLYNINVDQIRTKTLKVTDVNSSGDVTWEEVQSWINWIKESDLSNKDTKSAFFHLAIITGLRKDALCSLTYRDIRRSGDTWVIKSTLKGKTKKISIKDEDADLIFSLWRNRTNKDEKILKMSTKTAERLMDTIRKEFEIPKERNVTIHSLRGLSIFEAYLSSGKNILVAQEHAGHNDISTTYNYIKSRTDTMEQPSLYMGREFSDVSVKNLDKDKWVQIYNKLSRSSKYEIEKIMKELNYLHE